MLYTLKNCRNGEAAIYNTTVDITEKDGKYTFVFTAEHTDFYCPHHGYNDLHSDGDACEILIGSDPDRRSYYEIEISAEGRLMLAKMTYNGVDESGAPILGLEFVDDCFLESNFERSNNGYTATLSFRKKDILTGNGNVFFNAYRLETDGGEKDKHLFALFPTMRPKFHAPDYFDYIDKYTG